MREKDGFLSENREKPIKSAKISYFIAIPTIISSYPTSFLV